MLPTAVLGSVLLLGVDNLLDLPAESHEQRTTCDDTPCDGRDLQGEVLWGLLDGCVGGDAIGEVVDEAPRMPSETATATQTQTPTRPGGIQEEEEKEEEEVVRLSGQPQARPRGERHILILARLRAVEEATAPVGPKNGTLPTP